MAIQIPKFTDTALVESTLQRYYMYKCIWRACITYSLLDLVTWLS